MKKAIGLLTVFFIGVTCYAQQAAVIIPPFDLADGVTAWEKDAITRMFLDGLATKRIFRVADRINVEKRMSETNWRLGDYSNSEKTAEFNKGINADYLIIGSISKQGTNMEVEVSLEDLNTFNVVGTSRIRIDKIKEIFDSMDVFISTLVKNVPDSVPDSSVIAQPVAPPSGFLQYGLASWYSVEAAWIPTASGEFFDPSYFTAAHLTLPFGTILTVTNLTNNKSVNVKINDRGPFVRNRILNVSGAAAEQLGIIQGDPVQVHIRLANSGAVGGPAQLR
jgi:rare lipoprotein A